ncbi:hypothetical protein V2J09_021707 [Rumex salicifolius]
MSSTPDREMSLEAVVLQQLQSKRKDNTYHDFIYNPIFHYNGGFSDEVTHLSTTLENVISASSSSKTQNELSTVDYCTRRKRKRKRNVRKEVNVEEKRKKHIQVERNRRKEMSDKFSLLRSLMPPSYSLRGDQASIVGGAIIFVKELEQHLQYLQSHHYKRIKLHHHQSATFDTPSFFSSFFTFPQYSTPATAASTYDEQRPEPAVADVEVTVAERHATVKVLTRKQPKQLLRVLLELASAHLTVLHLNVTSIDAFVLYSFSLKKEDECQLNTVNEIATAVYHMITRIQQYSVLQI